MVIVEMNADLTGDITAMEVEVALKQMAPLKALGPDGKIGYMTLKLDMSTIGVLEAKEPSNALYAWKSILRGRDVIKRGATWRIGNGNSVHIWGDKWLPRKFKNKIISPPIARENTTMASEPGSSDAIVLQPLWKKI
ncbi:hypothetical protein SO802_009985 [Lithocarpus litseifolius]|uniref:Uncharacterized protein n=1 Tax=Lithocarpus litseifolius TaxID=425828 RepID=A0AAW2DFX6_9ROSI